MKRNLAAVVVCVAMLGIAGGQPPPPTEVPPVATSSPPVPVKPEPPLTVPAANTGQVVEVPAINAPAPPATRPMPATFDALVQELRDVRATKAELEKREKAITEALVKKFAEQKGQLEALGLIVTAPVPRDMPKLDDVKKDEFKKEDAKKPVGQ
jgi:hypothetical protein